ncbi:MAG: hypothetical protein WA797_10080 [Acidimicrobiales bacterium]
MARLEDHTGAPYPGAGTLRVHPDPAWVPHPPDDGSGGVDADHGGVAR